MTNVREELCQVAEIEQKDNETWPKFANRLVRTIDKKEVPEEDWSQLSPEAQEWYNSAVESITANAPIRTFPGEDPEPSKADKKEKKTKTKEAGESEGNGRPKRLPDDGKIVILVDKNPKRAGSNAASVFELYQEGMTVKEAIKSGIPRGHMNWDVDHGFIRVE